jgi:hypothetical protein
MTSWPRGAGEAVCRSIRRSRTRHRSNAERIRVARDPALTQSWRLSSRAMSSAPHGARPAAWSDSVVSRGLWRPGRVRAGRGLPPSHVILLAERHRLRPREPCAGAPKRTRASAVCVVGGGVQLLFEAQATLTGHYSFRVPRGMWTNRTTDDSLRRRQGRRRRWVG